MRQAATPWVTARLLFFVIRDGGEYRKTSGCREARGPRSLRFAFVAGLVARWILRVQPSSLSLDMSDEFCADRTQDHGTPTNVGPQAGIGIFKRDGSRRFAVLRAIGRQRTAATSNRGHANDDRIDCTAGLGRSAAAAKNDGRAKFTGRCRLRRRPLWETHEPPVAARCKCAAGHARHPHFQAIHTGCTIDILRLVAYIGRRSRRVATGHRPIVRAIAFEILRQYRVVRNQRVEVARRPGSWPWLWSRTRPRRLWRGSDRNEARNVRRFGPTGRIRAGGPPRNSRRTRRASTLRGSTCCGARRTCRRTCRRGRRRGRRSLRWCARRGWARLGRRCQCRFLRRRNGRRGRRGDRRMRCYANGNERSRGQGDRTLRNCNEWRRLWERCRHRRRTRDDHAQFTRTWNEFLCSRKNNR